MNDSNRPLIKPLTSWWYSTTELPLISGPCSAESEEQVFETASRLKESGRVDLLRAGIWKPRTRPGAFQGVGEIGLQWLSRVRKELKMPVTTEVANASHVELCLKYGVDVLWIGARTTVNPFSVQEIADALRGVDIPVIIKNPLNPDLQLWIGAIERLQDAGIDKIIAMHRGFSYYGKGLYRNKPMWEIPIALKSELPHLPIFCDPSHICGNRELLLQVAQKALDLGMSGLMLEAHPDPDNALSDAKQQVTPDALISLIDQLNIRSGESFDPLLQNKLSEHRIEIDKLDEEIIQLIAQRMKIAEGIGDYKREHNMTIFQLDRYMEIMKTRSSWAKDLGLSDDFIRQFLEQLHKESIRTQTKIMNTSGKENIN
jgi:chorismate mutase